MDPELQAAFIRYLKGEGPDPFGLTTNDTSNLLSQMPLPQDMDEYGSLGHAKDAANYNQDVNDLVSDPAQITQMSLDGGIGGWQEAAFDPIVSYEPVSAPGYQRIQFLKDSGDPIQEFIANVIGNGGTAMTAINELKAIVDDPSSVPDGQRYVDGFPQTTGRNTLKENDWGAVEKAANNLEKFVISDPSFNGIDPRTNLPSNLVSSETGQFLDNYRTNPDTNQLEKRIETQSNASEYFERVGLSTPFESYSPDRLTSPGQLAREDREGVASIGPTGSVGASGYQSDGTRSEYGEAADEVTRMNKLMHGLYMQDQWDESRRTAGLSAVQPPSTSPDPNAGREIEGLLAGRGDGPIGLANGTYQPTNDREIEDYLNGIGPRPMGLDTGDYRPGDRRPSDASLAQGRWDESRRTAGTAGSSPTRSTGSMAPRPKKNVRDRDDPLRVAKRSATQGRLDSMRAASNNFADNRIRERMIRLAEAQGHTPFNDEMRARQQNIMGF